MVDKGDQGLDEMPPSSFEEISLNEEGVPPQPPPGPNIENIFENSGEDVSEDGEEQSTETADTLVVSTLNAVGQALYDDTRCLVGLSQKVQGHTVYCGYPKNSCPRHKHTELQSTLGKRGPVGVYQQLPNSKGVVYDAIANTYMTHSEYEGRRKANHDLLTRLGSSPQKEATESLLRPRREPAIRIDTSPPGPRATRVGDWSRNLPETPHAGWRRWRSSFKPVGNIDGQGRLSLGCPDIPSTGKQGCECAPSRAESPG
jgi:hypothetical protein